MTEFVERMKKVHEEAEAALKKAQEDMKRQADRGRKEIEGWKKGDRVLLSTKDVEKREEEKQDRESKKEKHQQIHERVRRDSMDIGYFSGGETLRRG